VPHGVEGLTDIVRNAIFSTGVGLLQYGLKQQQAGRGTQSQSQTAGSLISRIKFWFQNNF
jgi:cell division protein FtsA